MEYRDILLTSEDNIKTYSSINDNVSGDYLLSAIAVAQRSGLEGIIGTALTNKLQELIGTDDILKNEYEHYKLLLDEYISDYLIYQSIVELIPIVSFKINNIGATKTDDEKNSLVTFNEVFKLKDYYQDKADYFAMRLQRFLIDNYSDYPELNDTAIKNIKANLNSAASCNIWLGGARKKQLIYDTNRDSKRIY